MTEVVSVKFKSKGKIYYFDPGELKVKTGDAIVVETAKGLEMGECSRGNHNVADKAVVRPLRPVVRLATPDDLRVAQINKAREKEAMEICQKKIAEHGLDMKLVDVECNFEGNKILFFFTSDGRVDFRELVKDLASVFRTRIELRQIGVRDEAKMMGGIGICGRAYCCSTFLDEFQPVSTKMAKIQAMSLNPTKISGSCGRLMCCLRYEHEAYEDLVKTVPKNGAFVETIDGYGNVVNVSLLRQKVTVRLDSGDSQSLNTYTADEVASVPGGRPKPGEPLPKVLKLKPKPLPEPEEAVEDAWEMPQLIIPEQQPERGAALPAEKSSAPEGGGQSNKSRRKKRKLRPEKKQETVEKTAKPEKPEKPERASGEESADKNKRRFLPGRFPNKKKPAQNGGSGNGGGKPADTPPKPRPPQQNQEKPAQDRPGQEKNGGGSSSKSRKPRYPRRKPQDKPPAPSA